MADLSIDTSAGGLRSADPMTLLSGQFKYQNEIAMMMYVFGEVRHPLPETTQLMEVIVREQMIDLLVRSLAIAKRRGSRYLSFEDIIFLIRHDRQKVARLTAYLSWRKVRKVANRAGNVGGGAGASGSLSAGLCAPHDLDDELQVVEEAGVGGQDGDKAKVKRLKIKLPWNLLDQFDDFGIDEESDSEDECVDDVYQEVYRESNERLKAADQATFQMTQEEYLDYAECRQASFTYKKPSRFKEWLKMDQLIGSIRANNDLLDILGFICYEMVRTLTETSLSVKKDVRRYYDNVDNMLQSAMDEETSMLERIRAEYVNKYKDYSLFSSPNERTPVEPAHVLEAYRRLLHDTFVILKRSSSAIPRTQQFLKSFNGGLAVSRSLIL